MLNGKIFVQRRSPWSYGYRRPQMALKALMNLLINRALKPVLKPESGERGRPNNLAALIWFSRIQVAPRDARWSTGQAGMKNASLLSSDLHSASETKIFLRVSRFSVFHAHVCHAIGKALALPRESWHSDSHASALIKSRNEGGALKESNKNSQTRRRRNVCPQLFITNVLRTLSLLMASIMNPVCDARVRITFVATEMTRERGSVYYKRDAKSPRNSQAAGGVGLSRHTLYSALQRHATRRRLSRKILRRD